MKKAILKALVCVSALLTFNFSLLTEAQAQDSVFSYTHQGTTLYYIIDSVGGAVVVSPLWPYYDEETDESWSGYTEPTGAVAVPDSVPFGGVMHAVTEVGHDAFYRCELLTSVTLPAAVTAIGEWAFARCSALRTVGFPDSLRTIGYAAFTFSAGPDLMALPAGLTTIGDYSFFHCDSIASVSIPGSVSTIKAWAFAECNNLTFVELGEGVDTIGFAAFWNCSDLYYITYPSTLKVIGDFAFQHDGALASDLVLHEGFTTMGVTAYGDNQRLTTVSLPGTMDTLTEEVFWGCTSLSKVTLGEGITTIGEQAFVNCPSLHSLTLPATLDSIGDSVFLGSTRIDTLVFRGSVPPAVPNSDSIFNDFHTLLIVPQGSTATYLAHPYWGRFMNIVEVFPYTHQGTTLYYLVGNEGKASLVPPLFPFSDPSPNSEADSWAGYTKPVGAVTVPDSVPYLGTMHAVTAVDEYTFYECGEITSVTLPPTVASLGSMAFFMCSAMQSVNIPDGVSRIPYACFGGCYALLSADVPSSVSVIDDYGFLSCIGMQTLTLHQGLDSIGKNAFRRCLALEHVTLPEGLRFIDIQAFMQDTSLRRIDLPSTLEIMLGNTFREATHLDSVIFPDNMRYLGTGILMDCHSLTYVHLPQNLEQMYGYLLYGTGLETFVVPPHVQSISYQVFSECPRLHKVTLPASVTTLYWGLFDNSPLDTLVLECTVPPALIEYRGRTTFSEYTATLIVPCGSADAYRADTVWGRFTNIIEDCTGIENVDPFADIKVYANHGRIVVEGTTDEVQLYDMMGRQLATSHLSPFTFHLSTPGVYLVKVGDRPAQKVVVMR